MCDPVCENDGTDYPITGTFECNDGATVGGDPEDGCDECMVLPGWVCQEANLLEASTCVDSCGDTSLDDGE